MRRLCWVGKWGHGKCDMIIELSLLLIGLGTCLRWSDRQEIAQFRRYLYGAHNQALIMNVIAKASETKKPDSRSDLIELVRTSKFRELVILHEPIILLNLGLRGPEYYRASENSKNPPTKRNRPPKSPETDLTKEPTAACLHPEPKPPNTTSCPTPPPRHPATPATPFSQAER